MKSTNILSTSNAYLPNNTRFYGTKTNTWKYLQVKTTNLLALYTMIMSKSYRFWAYTWGKPEHLKPTWMQLHLSWQLVEFAVKVEGESLHNT
jgi:hypothetical protein